MIFLYFLNLIYTKENAVIFILCRNSDLKGISGTLRNFEEMFNKQYKYPYVMVNDQEFTEEFKNTIKSIISTTVQFGKLTEDEFGVPKFINMNIVKTNMEILKAAQIIYGDSLSYRKMCRFFSGKFFNIPLLKQYRYYWRIEPDVKFYCKINYDPFTYLRQNNKDYSFVITIKEFMETIPSLYKETINFIMKNKVLIGNPVISKFVVDNKMTYNGCHYWSNFEIASFDFWRSEVYKKYFDFLDKSGGFFYERWGDAPVHTLALSLFLDKSKIHFFEDIGYEHPPFNHCPSSPSRQKECNCNPRNSIDWAPQSCLKDWINDVILSK
ncbi:glycolipid 2-alpha-mannosyltransferase [Vairimorpha necatrix]|uniref:Glycolipid 2-alpha-mannosyltransferase n=1 Tax=Vairimorpha necatrix TaxID=6039 RepID=A0AAX4JGT3_9MICR